MSRWAMKKMAPGCWQGVQGMNIPTQLRWDYDKPLFLDPC